MKLGLLGAVCAFGLMTASSQAQLVFGTTSTTTALPVAYYMDVTNGSLKPLWNSAANKKVNGAAADTKGKIYTNDAARLNVWTYGQIGTVPAFIAGMYRTNGTAFNATGVDDLCWANNNLYAYTTFPSTTYTRGIYRVNTTPDASNRCIMTSVWADTSAAYAFQGLTYRVANGLFYGSNTTDNTGTGGSVTRGIYTIDAFGSGTLTKIANNPVGHNEIDGLVLGDNNTLWMTEKDRTSNTLYVFSYNLTTNSYGTSYTVPYSGLNGSSMALATGATWAPGAVPEPTTILALGIGAGICLRRRKR